MFAFGAVVALLTIVPGVDTALVMRGTLTRSRRYAFAAMLGIQAGLVVWGAAAATGVAALLAASRTAYLVLCYLGAAYLVYLGATMIATSLRRRSSPERAALEDGAAPAARSGGGGFLLGFLTNLMNPKVGVFYIATIPQFVPEGYSPLPVGVLLALVHCLLGTVWLSIVILGVDRIAPRLRGGRAMAWIDRLTGGVLIAFGARLAVTTR